MLENIIAVYDTLKKTCLVIFIVLERYLQREEWNRRETSKIRKYLPSAGTLSKLVQVGRQRIGTSSRSPTSVMRIQILEPYLLLKWDSQGGRKPSLLAGNNFSMLAVLEDLHPKSGPQAKQGIFLCILAEPIIIDCIVSWSERSLHSVLFPEKPLPCMPLARCLFCLQFNCWISVHWERSPVTYDTAYSGAH